MFEKESCLKISLPIYVHLSSSVNDHQYMSLTKMKDQRNSSKLLNKIITASC